MSANNNDGTNEQVVTTAGAETDDQKLKRYADELNQLQTQIESNKTLAINHAKATLLNALKAGDVLREAKKLAGHGNWVQWLTNNVQGINERTAQNYMKLAEKAESEKTQHIAFIENAKSLRSAYIAVGIIKQAKNTEQVGTKQTKKVISPSEIKEADKPQYDAGLNDARQKFIEHVRKIIHDEKRLDWNLSSWTIKNNKPCSGDAINCGAALFKDLQFWVAQRECESSLLLEDEVATKTGIVLNEIVKAFISVHANAKTEDRREVNLRDYINVSVPINHLLPEAANLTTA